MPVPETYKPTDTKPESKHLRAEDFPLDQKWKLKVEDVNMETMPGRDGKGERNRLVLSFVSRQKGLVLNATNQGFIEARLGNAHQLVKKLIGPFDFIFCDADKEWYKNYFIDISPKVQVSGCYTAHNVSGNTRSGFGFSGTAEFYNYIKKLPGWETSVDNHGAGLSISYKKSP